MTKEWLKDMVERAASTFVETFLVAMLVSVPTDWSISTARGAALGGLAAAAAVVKAALASVRQGTISPASVAKS